MRFKLGLLYLRPERLLGQVPRWVLLLTVHVEATSPWWSRPMPVGMASEGGKPLDRGCFPRERASLNSLGFRWDPSLWTWSWTEGELGESTAPQGHLSWGACRNLRLPWRGQLLGGGSRGLALVGEAGWQQAGWRFLEGRQATWNMCGASVLWLALGGSWGKPSPALWSSGI